MIRELHLCHAFLVAVFATQTADLNAPQHARRVAATKELHRAYPWSVPACAAVVRLSDCPEAAERAGQVLQRAEKVREQLEWDARIWALIADPDEHDGLPWISWERYSHLYDSQPAREAMTRRVALMRKSGRLPDGVFWCETDEFRPWNFEGAMSGIQVIRFAARGLPWPYDPKPMASLWAVKRGWAMLKANGRGKP